MHRDPGVLHHEPGEQVADPVVQQGGRAAHAHDALGLRAAAFDHFSGRFGFHLHGHAMAVVLLADFGDGEMPGRALQQTYAQALLEFGDASAQR
ncbi:hypothetical protein D9M73_175940 [compost metagenome]